MPIGHLPQILAIPQYRFKYAVTFFVNGAMLRLSTYLFTDLSVVNIILLVL